MACRFENGTKTFSVTVAGVTIEGLPSDDSKSGPWPFIVYTEIEAVDAHFNRVLMQPEDHLYYSIDDRAHVTAEARAKEIEEEKQKRWRAYYNSFDHSLTPDTGFQHETCEDLFN